MLQFFVMTEITSTFKQTAVRSKIQPMAYVVCGLAALFYVYDYFIQVAPSIMTHELMRDFSIGAAGLSVLGSSFYYAYICTQIPAGYLLDNLGARKLLTLAILISACGVMLFGYTESFYVAAFSRFLIGFGAAFSFISALFLVSRWFPHQHFALIAGFIQLAACIGSMLGEAPLAMLINHMSWRPAMMNIGILTLLLAVLVWLVVRDGKPNENKTVEDASDDAADAARAGRSAVFRNPQVWWISVCGFISWVPVATIGALWGIPYLMEVYGFTNTQAGKICALFWLGLGLGSPFVGWLSEKIQSRRKPFVVCFLIGLLSSLYFISVTDVPVWTLGLALFFMGTSASVQSLSFGAIKDIVPAQHFGRASGFNNMFAIIGGGLGQTAVGLLLAYQWSGAMVDGVAHYSISQYRAALILVPAAMLFGLVATHFKLKESYHHRVSV